MLSANGSDSSVNAMIKTYGVEVKKTGLISRANPYLPGIGEAKELMADAFAAASPITSKAKKYTSGGWILVAVVSETQKADLSKFSEEREKLVRQINMRKERSLYDAWMKGLRDRAKIEPNTSVVGSEASDV